MFDDYYPYTFLGDHKTFVLNPVKTTHYRFQAKKRRYFVILEYYTFDFVAIKYCDKKDRNDKQHAFKKIFNDNDAFKVISTCLHIMRDIWKKNPNVNFAFYAVPRPVADEEIKNRNIADEDKEQFIQNYKRARFNIYEYAMLNLFPPSHFTQMRDYENSIYILLNKKNENKKKEILNKLGEFLLANHDILFEATDNEDKRGRSPRQEITFG